MEREGGPAQDNKSRTTGNSREKYPATGSGDLNLTCMYTNVNSILGKMQQLKFRAQDYDIIGIVEMHANKNINDAELSLEGFNLYRIERQDKRGGGLVIYVNSRLKSSLCTDIYSAGFEESVWCTILTDYGSLLVGLCYRSLSSDSTNNDKLLELFESAADYSGCTHVTILGDFNYPAINFKNNTVSSGCMSDASKFYEKMSGTLPVSTRTSRN